MRRVPIAVLLLVSINGNATVATLEPAIEAKLNALIERLDVEKDPKARLALIESVAELKSPRAVPTLALEMSNDKNSPAARVEALRGLEALNTEEGNDAIALAAMKNDSAAVRARSIEAIGNLKLKEFAPACVRGQGSDEPAVRRAAVEALAKFNTVTLAARIAPLVRDFDPDVKSAALKGIGKLQARLASTLLARGPIVLAAELARRD
jgi:HEAT repeat protein